MAAHAVPSTWSGHESKDLKAYWLCDIYTLALRVGPDQGGKIILKKIAQCSMAEAVLRAMGQNIAKFHSPCIRDTPLEFCTKHSEGNEQQSIVT